MSGGTRTTSPRRTAWRASTCTASAWPGTTATCSASLAAAERSLASVPAEVNSGGLAARAGRGSPCTASPPRGTTGCGWSSRRQDKRYPLEILGDALLELGDYDAAADAYAKMAAFGDGEADAASESRLARLALVKGDLAGARKHFDAAVALRR